LVVYQCARLPHIIQNCTVQSIKYSKPSSHGGHIWRYCIALYVAVAKSTDWRQETVVLIFSEIYLRSSPKADRKMTVIITALVWFTFSKMLQKASYKIGVSRNLSRACWVPLRIVELAIGCPWSIDPIQLGWVVRIDPTNMRSSAPKRYKICC